MSHGPVVVIPQTTQATDLSSIAAIGRIPFDLKVVYLAGASGLVGKAVCNDDANDCTTGDQPLNISVGNWVTNEINLADFPGFIEGWRDALTS